MNQVMIDIWPYLIVPLIGAIGWLFREVYIMKTKVAVIEKSIDGLQDTMKGMQDRLDSHSKKQDAILDRISSMEKELLGKMGDMAVNMSSLASDLRVLNNFISVSDIGIKVDRSKGK